MTQFIAMCLSTSGIVMHVVVITHVIIIAADVLIITGLTTYADVFLWGNAYMPLLISLPGIQHFW